MEGGVPVEYTPVRKAGFGTGGSVPQPYLGGDTTTGTGTVAMSRKANVPGQGSAKKMPLKS